MAGIGIRFANNNAGTKLRIGMRRQAQKAQRAAGATAREAAFQIQEFGRADIAAAGNFGSARWQQGFKATTLLRGQDFTIEVSSVVPYFMIFERGGVIHGKPLLWIPLSFATDAKGVMARDFPGGLFRVDRKSGAAPLLFSVASGDPKYFGKESVTIPKKFHIRQIITAVSQKMAKIYRDALARS
jgi:hypothetical protein